MQLADDGSAGPPGKKKAMGAQEGALAGAELASEPGKDQGPTVAQVRPACNLRAAIAAVCVCVGGSKAHQLEPATFLKI